MRTRFSRGDVRYFNLAFSSPEAALLLVSTKKSRPLARSNTGSPRFTDFPSLCACSESSLTNLIGSGFNLLCSQSHSKTECRWTRPEGQSARGRDFLVLTKRSAASGDENVNLARRNTSSYSCLSRFTGTLKINLRWLATVYSIFDISTA